MRPCCGKGNTRAHSTSNSTIASDFVEDASCRETFAAMIFHWKVRLETKTECDFRVVNREIEYSIFFGRSQVP